MCCVSCEKMQACEDSTVVLFSLARPAMGTKAIELGSGYGSGARYLALNFGATVDCVDLSQDANDLNRRLTEKAGLSHLVKVQQFFLGFFLASGQKGRKGSGGRRRDNDGEIRTYTAEISISRSCFVSGLLKDTSDEVSHWLPALFFSLVFLYMPPLLHS